MPFALPSGSTGLILLALSCWAGGMTLSTVAHNVYRRRKREETPGWLLGGSFVLGAGVVLGLLA